jgi:hypothetical protein
VDVGVNLDVDLDVVADFDLNGDGVRERHRLA